MNAFKKAIDYLARQYAQQIDAISDTVIEVPFDTPFYKVFGNNSYMAQTGPAAAKHGIERPRTFLVPINRRTRGLDTCIESYVQLKASGIFVEPWVAKEANLAFRPVVEGKRRFVYNPS